MRDIPVREPGAALAAQDVDGRLSYQTKSRTRATRGPRSMQAAIDRLALGEAHAISRMEERFSGVSWESAFGRRAANKLTHPAEQFFRFSALRYLVDESRKNARVNSSTLSRVLLDSEGDVNRLNKYYLDVPGEELPSLYICSQAAVAAFNESWLPYLTADYLYDEGAEAVLHLINFEFEEGCPLDSCRKRRAVGFSKTAGEAQQVIDKARELRLDINERARKVVQAIEQLRSAGTSAGDGLARNPVNVTPKMVRSGGRDRRVTKCLLAFRAALRESGDVVRWRVDASRTQFLHELNQLVAAGPVDGSHGVSPASAGQADRLFNFSKILVTLDTGLSMVDLARALGGGNFFQLIVGSSDWDDCDDYGDAVDFAEHVPDPVTPAGSRLAWAAPADDECESGFSRLDVWVPVP